MPPLHERQRAFAAALLDPDLSVPPGLIGPDGEPSARRFAVYRNNVVAGLVDALKAAFPAVCRLVGDEFFAAMARIYVSRKPPASPVMNEYGGGFPAFAGAFPPARELPYLRDVARLEWAWVEAYHAAEAAPVAATALAGIEPDLLPRIVLVLHPSVRIVRSPFPAATIWQMNIDGGKPGPVDILACGENALVLRPYAEVEIRTLPGGAAAFVHALAAGASIAEGAKQAFEGDPTFDLAGTLEGLFAEGAITGCRSTYGRSL